MVVLTCLCLLLTVGLMSCGEGETQTAVAGGQTPAADDPTNNGSQTDNGDTRTSDGSQTSQTDSGGTQTSDGSQTGQTDSGDTQTGDGAQTNQTESGETQTGDGSQTGQTDSGASQTEDDSKTNQTDSVDTQTGDGSQTGQTDSGDTQTGDGAQTNQTDSVDTQTGNFSQTNQTDAGDGQTDNGETQTESPPNVVVTQPKDQVARVGDSVNFECTVANLQNEYLEWRHFRDENDTRGRFIFMTGFRSVTDLDKYVVDESNRLTVKNVSLEDAGTYRCALYVARLYYSATLTVLENINCDPPRDSIYLEGDSVSVGCTVRYTGTTPPELAWTLTGGVHYSSSVNGLSNHTIEKIVDAQLDQQDFICNLHFNNTPADSAYRSYTDSCSVFIYVYATPNNVTIIHNDATAVSGRVYTKEQDTFSCSADGNPAPSVSWFMVTEDGESSVPDKILTVVEEMGHGLHEYTCRATNTIDGKTYTADQQISFYINNAPMVVEVPPRDTVAEAGEDVLLRCTVNEDAGKGWMEWWYKGDQKIFSSKEPDQIDASYQINGSYNLVIKQVSEDHSGLYECRLFPNNTKYSAELVIIKDLACDRSEVAVIPSLEDARTSNIGLDDTGLTPRHDIGDWDSNKWVPRTGQYIKVTCSVRYLGDVVPRVRWHNEATGYMKALYEVQERTIVADAYLLASSQFNDKLFSCLIDVENNDKGDAPEESRASCAGTMPVTYLRNLKISPDPSQEYGGVLHLKEEEVVKCQVEGSPRPGLTWRRIMGDGPEIVDGGVLKTTAIMKRSLNIYECCAWTEDGFIKMERHILASFYVY